MRSLTIVLVDDDPLMHRMLAPRLRAMDLDPPVGDVVSAQTPDDALAAVDRAGEGPLAVVSDFNLRSTMTGLELLGRVQERRPDALRILFSGYSDIEIGDVSGEGKAHAFFEKPLRLDDLVAPLERTLHARLADA